MRKLIAILNVIAWGAFWVFGYIALMSPELTSGQLTMATIIAALGFGCGMMTYLKLVRMAEATGYARASNKLTREDRERAQAQWEAK